MPNTYLFRQKGMIDTLIDMDKQTITRQVNGCCRKEVIPIKHLCLLEIAMDALEREYGHPPVEIPND